MKKSQTPSIKSFLIRSMLASAIIAGALTIAVSYYIHLKDLRPYLDSQLLLANSFAQQNDSADSNTPLNTQLPNEQKYDHPKHQKQLQQILSTTHTILWTPLKHPATFPTPPDLGFSYTKNPEGTFRTYTTQAGDSSNYFISYQKQQARNILEHGLVAKFLAIFLTIYLILFSSNIIILRKSMNLIRRCTDLLKVKEKNPSTPISCLNLPKELAPFFDSLNHYINQLQHTLDREKRFAADAAHELKTPLAALNTHLQVYAISKDPEKKTHSFKQAQASLKRSFHTIEQLLVLSKTLPETIHNQLTPINAEVFFHSIIRDYPQLTLALENNGPLHAHKDTLAILTHNIFSNAQKYGATQIRVELYQENNVSHIVLTDNGPGVPNEYLDRLSERFFRIYGTQQNGSGIGLSIVSQIVAFHQGTLSFSNQPPEGLRVHITLPTPS